MAETVRIGVIGTSPYADIGHLARVKSHPRAELAAVCGRNRERGEEMARKYDIPMVYTDHREMIEKGNLDAVVISTPDDLHYPMTMAALDAGLHVLCEKPMALNAAHAQEMYDKAQAAGVKTMICFTWRWMPCFQYMKELVDQGYTGRSYDLLLRYVGGHGREARYAWRFDRQRSDGILGDMGSHMIDLARWLVGDIARVSSHLATFVERPGPPNRAADPANDSALLLVEFDNGAQGVIHVSGVVHTGNRQQEWQVVLHGQSGALEADVSWLAAELRGIQYGGKQFEELPTPDDMWGDVDRGLPFIWRCMQCFEKQSIGDRLFIDAILEDQPVAPSFYDGLKAQEVMDAAVESHEKGTWVSIGGK